MRRDVFSTVVCSVTLTLVGLTAAPAQADSTEQMADGNKPDADNSETSETVLSTDRPGFTNTSVTVPTSRFQLEAGVGYTRTVFTTTAETGRPDSASINTFGVDALGRYGLNDSLEARLAVRPISITTVTSPQDTEATGLGTISLGAKYNLLRSDSVSLGVLPSFELASVTDAPSGSAAVSGLVDIHLLSPVSATVNATIGGDSLVSSDDNIDPAVSYSAAASFGYSFSEKVGGYAEYYMFGAGEFDPAHHVDGGFTYLLTNQLQLDLYGDYELTDDNSFQLGAGVAYLF